MQAKPYIANGGQTYTPIQQNIHVPQLPFNPPARPQPLLPDFELSEEAKEKGWVLAGPVQHFLPGVTVEMLDWWWANMEKGYYLWGPGAHKRFNWVVSPWQGGLLGSSHQIAEVMVPGRPVMGGEGIVIQRLGLEYFPFTSSLSHVIVEGIFNQKNELCDATIHMWESAPGGVNHYTAAVVNTKATMPPDFAMENPDAMPSAEERAYHAEYEASRWPEFLPTLYRLWEGHPDPTQNVHFDLRVAWENGQISYVVENGPVSPVCAAERGTK